MIFTNSLVIVITLGVIVLIQGNYSQIKNSVLNVNSTFGRERVPVVEIRKN